MLVEELFVNAFDGDKTEWLEVGVSPYLHDTVDDYIHTTICTAVEGDFDFADSAVGAGTINSVILSLFCKKVIVVPGLVRLRIYVWDGLAWNDMGRIFLPDIVADWVDVDVSAVIDSWGKIDGCRLYVITTSCSGTWHAYVYKAKLMIDYTPVAPPAKPFFIGDGLTWLVMKH